MSNASGNVSSGEHAPGESSLPDLAFPDLPRLELDKLLTEVSARAQEVLTTQGRLRALLRAHATVAGELSLPAVLQHIVEAARELVEARYAALGVIGEEGQLDQFVHVGMSPDTVAGIGELPVGHGILGLLIRHPATLRLTDLREHPEASGFPPRHPPMDSFLGVPIRVRDQVFGNLYLTGSANGAFTEEDEQLVVALAVAAGAAIDKARLYQLSEERRQWLTAATQIAEHLFAGQDTPPLDLVLRHAQDSAAADFATLALFTETRELQVKAATGLLAEQLIGMVVDLEHSVAGQVARSGTPVLTAEPAAVNTLRLPAEVGSVIVVPVLAGERVMGTLSVARRAGQRPFTSAERDHLAGFARHAGMAVELDRARADQQELRIADEHDRISLDLNEHVVQKLVSVSLGLHGLITSNTRAAVRERITEYVDTLDATIGRIRAAVYDLDPARRIPDGLCWRLDAAAAEEAATLGFPVDTTFTGQLNSAISVELTADAEVVVRGALAAIGRGMHASRVELRVDVLDDVITVEVIGNGPVTVDTDALVTFQRIAQRHGGTLRHATPAGGGAHLVWTARIPEPA